MKKMEIMKAKKEKCENHGARDGKSKKNEPG